MPAGQGAGMIDEVRPAGEILRDIVDEAERIIARLTGTPVVQPHAG